MNSYRFLWLAVGKYIFRILYYLLFLDSVFLDLSFRKIQFQYITQSKINEKRANVESKNLQSSKIIYSYIVILYNIWSMKIMHQIAQYFHKYHIHHRSFFKKIAILKNRVYKCFRIFHSISTLFLLMQ